MSSYLSSDGATELADESELMLLSVALHYGTSCPHLCHDAACPPQVNGGAVVSLTYQKTTESLDKYINNAMPLSIFFLIICQALCKLSINEFYTSLLNAFLIYEDNDLSLSFMVDSYLAAALEVCTRV